MQRLLDIAADVPGLLETVKRRSAVGNVNDPSDWGDTRCQVRSLLKSLIQWRAQWENTHPDSSFTVEVDVCTRYEGLLPTGAIPPKRYTWYIDFASAHEISVFDATLLVSIRLAESCLTSEEMQCIFTSCEDIQQLPLFSDFTTEWVVEEVYRSIPYFLHPRNRSSGAFAVFYALWAWYVDVGLIRRLRPCCLQPRADVL